MFMHVSEKIKALINLLGEQDPSIYQQIREEILDMGVDIIPELENFLVQQEEPLVRNRLEKIIERIRFRAISNEITTWCLIDGENLLKPWLSISRIQNPFLNDLVYQNLIEEITKSAWLELQAEHTCMEQIGILNKVIFELWKFTYDNKRALETEASYIESFFQSKQGNAWSLGMLYLIISEKLNIPIQGVIFPHNFVLCYRNMEKPYDILCYINPANGIIFAKKEIDAFLNKIHIKPKEFFYRPCNKKAIILQLIENLLYAYDLQKDAKRIGQLESLKEIIVQREL